MTSYKVTYQRPATGEPGSAAYRTKRFKTILEAMDFVEKNDWPIWQILDSDDNILGDKIPRYGSNRRFTVSERWWPTSIPSQRDYYEKYARPREILSGAGLTESAVEKFLEDKKDG